MTGVIPTKVDEFSSPVLKVKTVVKLREKKTFQKCHKMERKERFSAST